MSHLQPRQASPNAPTQYDLKLAGAIEEIFGTGRHDLVSLVDGLNELGVPAPGGDVWTPESFTTEIHRLAEAGKEG
jgi:hypothetical protein